MASILIADDDQHIREVVSFALEKAGYTIHVAENGKQAIELYNLHEPDLLVLDIMMPELDGTEVCREIRKTSQTPIIFLTAMSDEVDMIVGLEIGGDDYMTKPFSPRQLVARTRAVLRRTQFHAAEKNDEDIVSSVVTAGKLKMDLESCKAFWQDQEMILTATELRLLQVLAGRTEKVFSREELIQKAYDNVIVSDRTIDSHIRRVRAKIVACGGNAIETVHGMGYKLGPCE